MDPQTSLEKMELDQLLNMAGRGKEEVVVQARPRLESIRLKAPGFKL